MYRASSCPLFGLLGVWGPLVVCFSDLEPAYICEGLAKAARGCGYPKWGVHVMVF